MALALATIQRQRSTLHTTRFTLHTPRSTLHAPRFTLLTPRSTLHFFILLPSPFGEGSGVRLRFPCLQFAKIKVFIVK